MNQLTKKMELTTMPTERDSLQPPTLAFASFRSALQGLRDHGLPPVLDRTAWNTRSGTEQTQIVSALKFFRLTDEKGATQDSLKELVTTIENTEAERLLWKQLLTSSYEPVFKVDLTNATPKQLEDAIGEYGVAGLAKERAVRFFLKAATHAQIPLSTRLTLKLRDRSSSSSEASANGNGGGDNAASGTPKPAAKQRRNRRRGIGVSSPPPVPLDNGSPSPNAMKTILLPKVGGSLSITGTFNAFQLTGDERDLVYKIIDLMNDYESKSKATGDE